jgi:2-dehydropantoate 2-reductase
MKIAILGAGAMGCIYGARLSAIPQNQVVLVDVWKEHLESINREGILLEEGGVLNAYPNVRATDDPASAGTADLVIVFVKSTITAEAIRNNLALVGPETAVLTLQNGLGNIDALQNSVAPQNILAGTTAHGGTMLGPGKVRHAGTGKTFIGEISGEVTPRVREIAALFNEAGLDTDVSDNALGLVWGKLLSNVGLNALTAITGLLNGQILDYPGTEELMTLAVLEAKAVADALGVKLAYDDPVEHTRALCKATAPNRSSMLQDVTAGRRTEIDMINGAIVREGRRFGIPTPINLALTDLIKTIEQKQQSN